MSDQVHQMLELDRMGFLCPPDADAGDHIQRSRNTLRWAQSIQEELDTRGRTRVMGETFTDDNRVSPEVLTECLNRVTERYSVTPEWVPAFYSNEFLPWYVGGASFYGPAEDVLQVCFLLRSEFRERSRWLIYNRAEIASHEACHVARSGFGQGRFEEPLAYAISRKRIRRVLGGMFNGRWEAPGMLMSSLLLAAGSVAGLMGAPWWVRVGSAIPLLGTGGLLGIRTTRTHTALKKARRTIGPVFGRRTDAVLFRCTDREIESLARLQPADAGEWVGDRPDSPRWRVIKARFENTAETGVPK